MKSEPANFLLVGQSNIGQWFEDDGGDARARFSETFRALTGCPEVECFPGVRGGSAMLARSARRTADGFRDSDPDFAALCAANYWYDEEQDRFGPTFEFIAGRIGRWRRDGVRFAGLIWSQGEGDSEEIDSRSAPIYRKAQDRVLRRLASLAGCRSIFIQEIGRISPHVPRLHDGLSFIREAQRAFARKHAHAVIASTTIDLPLADSTHLTPEGYTLAAERMATAIATGETSPAIARVERRADGCIALSVDLGPGQSLDTGPGADAFDIRADGRPVAIETLESASNGRIVLRLAEPVENLTIDYAGNARLAEVRPEALLKTSGPRLRLPVRPARFTVGGAGDEPDRIRKLASRISSAFSRHR